MSVWRLRCAAPATRFSSPRRRSAAGIFAADKAGIDGAEALVAIMDGPAPDAGTCWEVGYAFGVKPIVLVRTDFRVLAGSAGDYSPMLTQAATIRLDLPGAPTADVVVAILEALTRIDADSSAR